MRIQKVTRNLLLEQDYQITLADTTAVSIQTQTVLTVIEHENIINNNRLRDLNKARRGWRTTEDLRNMVYDTDGYFDTDNIKPNSIDTNMLTVGAKSQQFVLSGCVLQANFGGNPNMFVATAGILSHLTIDNDKIRNWQMNEASFKLQSTGGYYLFAKCSKSGEKGVWYLTQEQLKFEPTSDPNNYYFQVGIVSSLYADDNFRDFQTTYGFTRINGNTITTGRIITSDGECYLDLDGNKFRIGDSTSSIDWNVSAKSRLTLKNVSVASGSGDVVPLGVYRGVWNKDYIYYTGDEVAYTSNGATCTYRYIHPTPTKGNLPTNSTYWEVVAQGADGDGMEYIFQRTEVETAPSTPLIFSPNAGFVPSGWTDEPSGVSADYPFEWVSMRKKTNGVWGGFSEPTLWNNYVVWNPNLLEQTEFESMDRLDRWDVVSRYNGGSGIDTSIAHINTSGVDGHNCFYDRNDKRYSESVYKEVLQQTLQSSTVKKLQPSTWYTLSFWAKCGTNTMTINETSSAYGFARRTLYLKKGSKYRLTFSGRIDAQAKSDGKELRVFVWQTGWAWSKSVAVSNTYDSVGILDFDDVPSDGEYQLAAFMYDSTDPRTGTVTLNWIRLLEVDGAIFHTYIFPSAIDTTKVFVDGVQKNNVIGADCAVGYKASASWVKHTVTFKTKSSFADTECVLFRLLPIIIEGNSQYLYICMPKLELGKVVTAYDANSSDNRPDYQEYRFAKNGSRNSAPTLVKTDAEPSGWTTTQPTVGTLEYLWMVVAKKSATGALLSNWSEPVRITPYDGKDGENGKSPAMVYRGVYDSNKTYYGNQYRVDAVKYNGTYYVARIDAGEFYNVAPTNTSKWNNFGAQFDSIATGLLLAENANIAGWIFKNGKLYSQNNSCYLDGKTGDVNIQGNFTGKISTVGKGNRIVIDPSSNTIIMYNTVNNNDVEVLRIESEDIGFGLRRPKIIMNELAVDTGQIMNKMILSAYEFGWYRLGNGSNLVPMMEIKGGWSGKKIILSEYVIDSIKPNTKGQIYRSGDTLKIVT